MIHKRYAKVLLVNLLLLGFIQISKACGYDWVGDCSSSVHLRINGTLDSFIIADCPSGITYQGLQLGTLRTLFLANAKAITWESCINNVTGVGLKYRICEQGGGAGSFQTLQLAEDYNTLQGPYTTRYRSNPGNIDLTTGLTIGKTYVLEVYFLAEVDTIGDDFIPETTLTKNNNGQNYKLTFTYGGPNASPFVVNPTLIKAPNCHGESNGSIGVSVWGDLTGISYNWSNVNLNFFQQNGIPAGTYTVTVTGVNHSASTTFQLNQPDILSVQASNIQPVSCGGGQGTITAQASGGTAPYHYNWQNGQTTQTASFSNAGSYALTVSDAHNCTRVQSLTLPGGGTIQQSSSRTLCTGQSIVVAGVQINAAGVYNLNIPGNGGCDTLLTLTVSEVNPGALLTDIPSNILLTCLNPSTNLCATVNANASYQWSKDGIPATPTPCLLASAGGVYKIVAKLDGCEASKNIVSEEHLVHPTLSAGGGVSYLLKCYEVDSIIVHYSATGNATGGQYQWSLQGQVISNSPEFSLYYDSLPTILPSVTVTDQFGCKSSTTPTLLITFPPLPPDPYFEFDPDLCQGLVNVDFIVFGIIDEPYTMTWNGAPVTGTEFLLPPGEYAIEITDKNGCVITDQETIYPLFNAFVQDSPSPNSNMGIIFLNSLYWFNYLWDDGAVGEYRYGLAPGDYCVTLTDQNNCTLDTCFTIQGSVATKEVSTAALELFPNPATPGAWLTIQLPENLGSEQLVLELIDAQGKIIQSRLLDHTSESLRFQTPDTLNSGLYTIRLTSNKGQALGKISLKK